MTLTKRKYFLSALLCFLLSIGFAREKFTQSGIATYYADYFQGRYTSCGEKYDKTLYTAAHATLPFQMLVKVTNLKNNKYIIVKINDRCPKYYNRIIDLSKVAATKLDMLAAGIANVTLEEITPYDLNIISEYPEKTDTIIINKLFLGGLMEIKNTIKTYYKDKNEGQFYISGFLLYTTEKAFMIKPKETGVLIYSDAKLLITDHRLFYS
jgi:rare lipoprotein A